MRALTLNNVTQMLAECVRGSLDQLVTDPQRADYGALIHPVWGLPSPGGSAALVTSCVLLYLHGVAGRGAPHPKRGYWLERALLAAEGLRRAQRPSGLFDLTSCNYDSAPDTGFVVQRLCPLVELGRALAPRDPNWDRLVGLVEELVRRAVGGILAGGFHTPNHRWVIASALAYAAALWPDLDVRAVVESYVREGFDVDAEGAFIEHSVGVYDAVCDRSLLLLAEHWPDEAVCAAALEAVRANLDLDLHLLHADGTAETGLSRRQDYGTRRVPLGLAGPYLHGARLLSEPRFARVAEMLWRCAPEPHLDALNWLAYALYKYGDPTLSEEPSAALPDDYARFYPVNGIWRARRGALSATLFRDSSRLLSLVYGQAELVALKIHQAYFADGRFVGDRLEAHGLGAERDTAVLHSAGETRPNRPGYDLPLGRPVPPERWYETIPEREYIPFPPCAGRLTVTRSDQGLELRYQTLDNYPGVTAQLALDFAPGGIWETGDTCLQPQAGQVLFLKRGYGIMRYGNDVIRVGPGAFSHRTWKMRHAETAPEYVRVLLTFHTPVDQPFSLHVAHGPYDVRRA